MINRYRIKCRTCDANNTLRITLGSDERQEHSFACANCGEQIRVGLNIDFKKRVSFSNLPKEPDSPLGHITAPSSAFECIENCEITDEEGTITNLDPNFLVPEDILHQDGVFPWMYESRRIGIINKPIFPAPIPNDILHGIGIQRNLRGILEAFSKAWRLLSRGKQDLSSIQFESLKDFFGLESAPGMSLASIGVAMSFLGQARANELEELSLELLECKRTNESEYHKFREEVVTRDAGEYLDKIVGIIEDYLSGYNQFFQTWIYASRNIDVDVPAVATSKDLRKVRMFYGNAFEELSTLLIIPACLNNIKHQRPYHLFESMDLKRYLTINKANRNSPFADNSGFSKLHDEFDSVLRNASHHAAIRMRGSASDTLEYRPGDSGQWKEMSYAQYLLKSNRILMCLMRLLLVLTLILEDPLTEQAD